MNRLYDEAEMFVVLDSFILSSHLDVIFQIHLRKNGRRFPFFRQVRASAPTDLGSERTKADDNFLVFPTSIGFFHSISRIRKSEISRHGEIN